MSEQTETSGKTLLIEQREPFRLGDGFVTAICILGAFFAFFIFWQDLNSAFSRHAEQVGAITFKLRSAQRRFADRVLWSRLRQNSAVFNGDLIRTAELSEATITFAQGQKINLTENTIVRIFVEDDQVIIELNGGNLNIATPADAPEISIIHGEDRIIVNGGTTAAFRAEESDTRVWVSEGSVSVADTEVPAGTSVSIGQGLQNSDPSIVLTLPPEAEFYGTPEALVDFSWSTNTNEKTRLEIAQDRRFTEPYTVLDTEDDTAAVLLPPGNFWWRAYPVNEAGNPASPPENAMTGKVSISLAEGFAPEPETPATPPLVAAPPAAPPPVSRPAAAPPPLLPTPLSRTPATFVVDADYLRKSRSIDFSWNAVPGASGYIFTLYKEGPTGRQEILRNGPAAGTSYTVNDIRSIGEGNFVWQLEAVNQSGGQRGNIMENRFTVNIPQPKDPKVQETGTLYVE
jgi:hypothetical protein